MAASGGVYQCNGVFKRCRRSLQLRENEIGDRELFRFGREKNGRSGAVEDLCFGAEAAFWIDRRGII